MKTADRLENFKAYLGPAMNQKIALMKADGRDVINLGLGDPDTTPPEHILEALVKAASGPNNHHYPSAYPINPLYEAIAGWYKKRYNVEVDPETEVLYLMGAAEGLYQIPNCLLDAGEAALVADPAYPSYEAGIKLAGGEVIFYPLTAENDFLPDLDGIPANTAKRAKLIWVNFPNNPTAAAADENFYRKLIEWAKEYDVWVLSDNPYMEISFDGYRPVSFLSLPGAKEVGAELNSMSKSFNCCGWRVGMLLGNRKIIEGMAKIKSQADRGIFYPLQAAATAALTGPVDWMEERNRIFAERRDVVHEAWTKMGFAMMKPMATFYCWGKIPEGFKSRDFSMKLLDDQNVWMIPGSTYGEQGEGYVRISNAQPVERLSEAMERIKKFIS